jgi:hypothetical protein
MSAVEDLLLIEYLSTSDSMKQERNNEEYEKREGKRILINFAYPSVLACGPRAAGTPSGGGYTVFMCIVTIKWPGFRRSLLPKINCEYDIGAHLQKLALPVFKNSFKEVTA